MLKVNLFIKSAWSILESAGCVEASNVSSLGFLLTRSDISQIITVKSGIVYFGMRCEDGSLIPLPFNFKETVRVVLLPALHTRLEIIFILLVLSLMLNCGVPQSKLFVLGGIGETLSCLNVFVLLDAVHSERTATHVVYCQLLKQIQRLLAILNMLQRRLFSRFQMLMSVA